VGQGRKGGKKNIKKTPKPVKTGGPSPPKKKAPKVGVYCEKNKFTKKKKKISRTGPFCFCLGEGRGAFLGKKPVVGAKIFFRLPPFKPPLGGGNGFALYEGGERGEIVFFGVGPEFGFVWHPIWGRPLPPFVAFFCVGQRGGPGGGAPGFFFSKKVGIVRLSEKNTPPQCLCFSRVGGGGWGWGGGDKCFPGPRKPPPRKGGGAGGGGKTQNKEIFGPGLGAPLGVFGKIKAVSLKNGPLGAQKKRVWAGFRGPGAPGARGNGLHAFQIFLFGPRGPVAPTQFPARPPMSGGLGRGGHKKLCDYIVSAYQF